MADQTRSGPPTFGGERRDGSWRGQALCQGMDTETFFPIGSTGLVAPGITEAKKVCGGCPVQAACLEWAINHAIDHGIWGGYTEGERRTLVLHRRALLTRSRLRSVQGGGGG